MLNTLTGFKSRKPALHKLDLLKDRDKTVKVIDSAAHKWETLAIRLHFKFADIKRIEKDCHFQTVDACRTVMGEWLEGKGRVPVTWETLIKVLNESGLSELSKDLEDILQDLE